jgi:hypothetical protein
MSKYTRRSRRSRSRRRKSRIKKTYTVARGGIRL